MPKYPDNLPGSDLGRFKQSSPASRDEPVEQARAHGMDDQIIETLRSMPERRYRSMDDVRKDLGGQGYRPLVARPPGCWLASLASASWILAPL